MSLLPAQLVVLLGGAQGTGFEAGNARSTCCPSKVGESGLQWCHPAAYLLGMLDSSKALLGLLQNIYLPPSKQPIDSDPLRPVQDIGIAP